MTQQDEIRFAKLIASSLQQDDIDFLELSEEQQTELVIAYAADEVKKFDKFMTAYQTRAEVRATVQKFVYNSLK